MSGSNTLKFVKGIISYMIQSKGYEHKLLEKVILVSAGNGSCLAEMKVETEHQNSGGTLHGGCSATLVDVISTVALMTHGDGRPGVSVNMNISYLKAAKNGEVVQIDAKTVRAGRNLAFLEVDIKNKLTGDILVTGTHTKYIGQSS